MRIYVCLLSFFCFYVQSSNGLIKIYVQWKKKGTKVKYWERIEYLEARDRLLFGSHETSPIIWLGKTAPAIRR